MTTNDKLADALITHDEAAEAVAVMDDYAMTDLGAPPMRWRETLDRYIEQQRAASLAAPPAQGEWVMTPRVPTPEMDAAGKQALSDNGIGDLDDSDALICYAAMLAARPQPAPAPVQADRVAIVDDPKVVLSAAFERERRVVQPLAPAADGAGELPHAVRFFAADENNSEYEVFDSADLARAVAQRMLDSASDDAAEDGWIDEPPSIYYGIVLGACVESYRGPAPEGSDFSEIVNYRLTDIGEMERAAIAALQQAQQAQQPAENVVDHMVNRFLSWKLPQDFAPDCGISFAPLTNPEWTHDVWPIGTNLLHAGQAKALVEHMLAGIVTPTSIAALRQAVPDAVRELPGKWRSDYRSANRYWNHACERCATELESALAASAEGKTWRCEQCGELSNDMDPAWRWTGDRWQHHHEAVGHVDARAFGAEGKAVDLEQFRGAVSLLHLTCRRRLRDVRKGVFPAHYLPIFEQDLAQASALLDLIASQQESRK